MKPTLEKWITYFGIKEDFVQIDHVRDNYWKLYTKTSSKIVESPEEILFDLLFFIYMGSDFALPQNLAATVDACLGFMPGESSGILTPEEEAEVLEEDGENAFCNTYHRLSPNAAFLYKTHWAYPKTGKPAEPIVKSFFWSHPSAITSLDHPIFDPYEKAEVEMVLKRSEAKTIGEMLYELEIVHALGGKVC